MSKLERKWLGPLADIAADLARGFDCGNCNGTFGTHNCVEDGCASLHDGIYEELKYINNQASQVSALKGHLGDILALMQGDIDYKLIEPGELRTKIMNECRDLIARKGQ